MAITTLASIYQKIAEGKGCGFQHLTLGPGATTAAVANSGNLTIHLHLNAIGTTYPGTLISLPQAPTPNAALFPTYVHASCNSAMGLWLVRLYNMGTLNLAATGNQFTADAAVTYPLTRTVFGATTAIPLLPVLYVTTATTTTAAALRLQTATGTAGYTDPDGNATIGTVTFTMPAAATAVQSAFILRLNNGNSGDFALRAINQIRIDTAASAGAARIFGMELLVPLGLVSGSWSTLADCLLGGAGFSAANLAPAAPTAGTLTSYLAYAGLNRSSAGEVVAGTVYGVENN